MKIDLTEKQLNALRRACLVTAHKFDDNANDMCQHGANSDLVETWHDLAKSYKKLYDVLASVSD